MEDMIRMQLPVNNNNTRGHLKKLNKKQRKTEIRQSQSRLCVDDIWNIFPEYVVEALSIKSFECSLDKFSADKPICFDQESQILTTCSGTKPSIRSEDNDLDIEVM